MNFVGAAGAGWLRWVQREHEQGDQQPQEQAQVDHRKSTHKNKV